MGLPVYLAQTRREILETPQSLTAFMACRFSPDGPGLDMREEFPKCNMLILNDSIPLRQQDPELVAQQLRGILASTGAESILLDFQRKEPSAVTMAQVLSALPCPVGVTQQYASCSEGPVFISLSMDNPLKEAIKPWEGRELWLDAVANDQYITVTEHGAEYRFLPPQPQEGIIHRDLLLHCSYRVRVLEDRAEFTLFRTREDLDGLLQEAEALGFTRAVGLYQEIYKK